MFWNVSPIPERWNRHSLRISSRQISQYYEEMIQNRNAGNLSGMAAAEQQFMESCSTYQIVVSKGTVSFCTANFLILTAQIQTLQSEEATPIDTITSDSSAYFVSHVDGLESVLTAENLANITPEQIQDIT